MMWKKIILTWLVAMEVALPAFPVSGEESRGLETLKDKVSYGLGVTMARNFQRQRIAADPELVMKGLTDELSGTPLQVPEEELRIIMGAFQHELNRRRIEARKLLAEENEKNGEVFLEENKTKKGVVGLPSGLQYLVLKAGQEKTPKETDIVKCSYRSTLLDGTELDRSDPENPPTFKVTSVIPGWKEALQLMSVGSKWRLFIPSHLAYGEKRADTRIGPNATLIIEVELLSISASDQGGITATMR